MMVVAVVFFSFANGHANPSGGSVRHGSATIVQNGNLLTINQTTGLAILDWNSFSIAQGETTKFVQPSASSMALNRVNGGTQSLINGTLEANGGVILINPAGILVGNSGVVNVNSFIASTRDVSDSDFLSGKSMKFQGNSTASIQNLGTIHAESGDIYLIARTIINKGTLSANKGTVGLASGDEVLLQPAGDERLSILDQGASGGKIVNSGTIHAVAAEIKAVGNPYAVAINLDGLIQAKGVSGKKAKVVVDAGQGDIQMSKTAKIDTGGDAEGGKVIVQSKGNLEIAGTVLATSATGNGGEIQLLGDSIHLASTAVVDASGFAGGGNIFVGGDYQGGNNPDVHYSSTALPNAQTLQVDQGAKLMANATGNGNGGVVIQWSDGTTVSSGSVSVQGGPLGGNGGLAEISGKENLGFNGAVDLSAPKGTPGTVLLERTRHLEPV
jgi:filamentous hemagglutinin family protein